ncbi:hypothetical protein AKJ16_DCAP18514 [Drosera capensis]
MSKPIRQWVCQKKTHQNSASSFSSSSTVNSFPPPTSSSSSPPHSTLSPLSSSPPLIRRSAADQNLNLSSPSCFHRENRTRHLVKASAFGDLMKSEERNNSIDTCVRQAIGKDPFLSFTRAGDSPVQWFQLFNAFDQLDISGWPLFSPIKVQMRKCDKCSKEFCSTINYRRHTRCHRRSLNPDKDFSAKNREYLQVYWDKLSTDEAVEVLSFKDVNLEGVSGASIVTALTSFIRKPAFSPLPHAYVRAGTHLLDILQGRPSRFPLTSQELFSILDDASENTFLCAGTAESLQKFVFDGAAGNIGLEFKNLIACTSFLIEQKLVRAWLADKDAEALRCQKILVDEEEAAQKRPAMLLEKKRQKKLRQKEHKMKELAKERFDLTDEVTSTTEGVPSEPTTSPTDVSDSDSQIPFISQDSVPSLHGSDPIIVEEAPNQLPLSGSDAAYPDSVTHQNVEQRPIRRSLRRLLVNYSWQGSKMQQTNGFYVGPNHQAMKVVSTQKHGTCRDSRPAAVSSVSKVWTPKPRLEANEGNPKVKMQNEPKNQESENKDSQVLIGSISVALGSQCHQQSNENNETADNGSIGLPSPKKNEKEKGAKPDRPEVGVSRSTVKIWRPVSRNGLGTSFPVQEGSEEAKVDALCSLGSDDSHQTRPSDDSDRGCGGCMSSAVEEHEAADHLGASFHVAEAFLAQRWKEAMASDPTILVLGQEGQPPGSPVAGEDSEDSSSSVLNQRIVLGGVGNGSSKSKLSTKSDRGKKVRGSDISKRVFCGKILKSNHFSVVLVVVFKISGDFISFTRIS